MFGLFGEFKEGKKYLFDNEKVLTFEKTEIDNTYLFATYYFIDEDGEGHAFRSFDLNNCNIKEIK